MKNNFERFRRTGESLAPNYILEILEMRKILADISTRSNQNHVIFNNSDNFLIENLSVSANI